ncbi:MAG: ZIP family metal transporter [Desulfarculaceae bacterium]|nr:ZIP family metal transporter [Desulfarculaceae bacterium]MCF8072495.1 ZIP family metal transporter [Desulfarculaceae bacterium]MCF8102956.1 ZIP family metal transporter [Desulfarculaceae bacterium]MCF8117036.1 ZIP family metal transporter [Desulfarculaceae bacterium]
MEFINLGSILEALVITLVLMLTHYLSPLIGRVPGGNERRLRSFAGGVAVAYVFLHMLPELVEGKDAVGEVLGQVEHLTPLLDLAIFLVALIGFTIYYGLELLATRQAERSPRAEGQVYALHLGAYCLYNFLITYTMPLRVQTGLGYAVIFTAAMALHFTFTDRGLNRHFPRRFHYKGRLLLVASLGAGWVVTALTDPINVLAVSLMIAFLSGSILYNVFKEELPTERESSYPWFSLGLGLATALLALEAYTRH